MQYSSFPWIFSSKWKFIYFYNINCLTSHFVSGFIRTGHLLLVINFHSSKWLYFLFSILYSLFIILTDISVCLSCVRRPFSCLFCQFFSTFLSTVACSFLLKFLVKFFFYFIKSWFVLLFILALYYCNQFKSIIFSCVHHFFDFSCLEATTKVK